VEYNKAPESKIEKIIEECIEAFQLLILNLEALFHIKLKRLIISGDSAGGFISLNITNYLIKNRLRIPDAVILIYPCTRLYFREMCPSNFLALTDYVIDSPFLSHLIQITLDINSYYKREYNFCDNHNFFLTEDAVVGNYPPTYIMVGSNDPIRDECYRLADFLLSKKVVVELKEYLYFPHGFMNITTLVDKYYYEGVENLKEYVNKIFKPIKLKIR
jgi:hormone-sensitive lipase